MVLTSFPSHATGNGPVKVRITASTVCQPHGEVDAGQIVVVPLSEFYLLKHAGKAELYFEDEGAGQSNAQDDDASITVEQAKAELAAKTKAELVEVGAKNGLVLSESSKKDELIAAIIEAAAKA